MRTATLRVVTLVSALALLAGCRGEPSQILVIVEADPGVRAAAGSLSVEIYGGAREASGVPSILAHSSTTPMAFSTWPRRYAVAPLDGDADRLWRFVATARRGMSEDSEAFVTARLVSGYRRGETLQVVLRLTDACIGVSCESPDETCDPALRSCRPAFVEARELDPLAPEGGTVDAGTEMLCVSSADCDDGVACTDDRCLGGLCSHAFIDSECLATECGVALCLPEGCSIRSDDARCDDAISCTVDRCSASGTCSHEPDDTACTAGMEGVCSATDDCQYATCDGSTCSPQPDLCRGAMCDGATCNRPSTCDPSTEMCCAGTCVASGCDDGDPCTDDSCGAAGCVHVVTTGSCNDGNPCTIGDICTGGVCRGSPCNDFDPCTTDFCDATMTCRTMPALDGTPCDNSDACPGDVCVAGACMPASCGGFDGGVDAGRDAGRDSGPDASDGDASDRDASDADASDGDADASDASLCDGSVCATPMEVCCGGNVCCDMTTHSCVGGLCMIVEAGGPDGSLDACGGACVGTDTCCDFGTPHCCPASTTCSFSGCLGLDDAGV